MTCWNACEPIADPENVVPRLLNLNQRVPDLEGQVATLRTQRDELLNAARHALRWAGEGTEVRRILSATIAKVEGGAA